MDPMKQQWGENDEAKLMEHFGVRIEKTWWLVRQRQNLRMSPRNKVLETVGSDLLTEIEKYKKFKKCGIGRKGKRHLEM